MKKLILPAKEVFFSSLAIIAVYTGLVLAAARFFAAGAIFLAAGLALYCLTEEGWNW